MVPTRLVAAAAATLLSAIVALPAVADAPDPIPSATSGSLVVNQDGSRTLTVWGGTDPSTDPGWQWTTHKSDCNTDRAGAGVALVWNDPTDQGGAVTGTTTSGSVTVHVGTSADQVVHPTPLQSPLAAVDIAVPSQYKNWRGGCGLYVNHPTPVQLPNNTTKTGYWSQGIWGPFSHTYPASVTGPLSVCPLMYDVHGTKSDTAPQSDNEVTSGGANHNDDNSLQKNGSTPQGNGCFTTQFGAAHLNIVKQVSADGGTTYSKSVSVHQGDSVRFRFSVNNDGGVDLTNVHVNELSQLADCQASMTPASADIGVGHTAEFTCDHVMGTQALDNVASATGSYLNDSEAAQNVTSANDTAHVGVLAGAAPKPQIALDKSGPASAAAGDKVAYTLTVTNPGNVAIPEPVTVSDGQCNGDPVTLLGKGADGSTGTLDPGDVWTYSCSVDTLVGQDAVHNTASVSATAANGAPVSASAHADTTLTAPDAQLVLAERIGAPGRADAQILAPYGCASRAFTVRVRGTKIASVVVLIDGKVVKKAGRLGKNGLAYRVNTGRLKIGIHRIVANITFLAGSGTKPKTLRMSFQRCHSRLLAPRFTG